MRIVWSGASWSPSRRWRPPAVRDTDPALIRQLESDRLRALFTGAGVTQFNHVLSAAHDPADWVAASIAKVDEIERGGPCLTAARLTARGE